MFAVLKVFIGRLSQRLENLVRVVGENTSRYTQLIAFPSLCKVRCRGCYFICLIDYEPHQTKAVKVSYAFVAQICSLQMNLFFSLHRHLHNWCSTLLRVCEAIL